MGSRLRISGGLPQIQLAMDISRFQYGQHGHHLGLFCALVAATACMLVGFKTRWATAIVWFGMLCFYFRNDFIMNSGDRLLNAILFILMLNPIGRAWSIDSRQASKRNARSEPARVAPWGVRVLQWQIALLHFSTGVRRPMGPWWDGTVIHYVLNDVTMTHWSFALLPLPSL